MKLVGIHTDRVVLFPGSAVVISLDPSEAHGLKKSLDLGEISSIENLIESNSSEAGPNQPDIYDCIPANISGDDLVMCLGNLAKPSGQITSLARILKLESKRVILEGIGRVKVNRVTSSKRSKICELAADLVTYGVKELSAVTTEFDMLRKSLDAYPSIQRLLRFQGIPPGFIVDAVASVFPLTVKTKEQLLNEPDVTKRIQLLTSAIRARLKAASTASTVVIKDKNLVDKKSAATASSSRDMDEDDESDGLNSIAQKLLTMDLGDEGNRTVKRELAKIKRLNSNHAEYQVCRSYLEALADIPWNQYDDETVSADVIAKGKEMLDADHYGLDKVKNRLLEYLAVVYLQQQQQKQHLPGSTTSAVTGTTLLHETVETETETRQSGNLAARPPILLLVGPPGVGKTSLAKSVSKVLGRKMYRLSLGGVRDEAEIRGHRRTYVGSMPGVIVQGLRRSKVMNPVIVLDEIDKLAATYGVRGGGGAGAGDPSAAMLEVLDPEQNYSFRDHYINFPVDLSHVLFIATANSLDTIPRPLLDRMEVIEIPGYSYMEKVRIAKKYLLPKQIKANGGVDVTITDDALAHICTKYTRESGVRELERLIGSICRGVAVEAVRRSPEKNRRDTIYGETVVVIKVEDVSKYLGAEKYADDNDDTDGSDTEYGASMQEAGVVNGLAYMGSGVGGLLTFEARLIPVSKDQRGSSGVGGNLKLTGQLGEVISESAQIALSWVKSNVPEAVRLCRDYDIHLHAPAGAIPKDGPSAGVAMTLTFISLFINRPVSNKIAMTGEMTLRGKVLPVGGIREKLLGAHLAGINTVILPRACKQQVDDAKECVELIKESKLEVVYVKNMLQVIQRVWKDSPYIMSTTQQSLL